MYIGGKIGGHQCKTTFDFGFDRDTMQTTLSDLETGTYYIVVTTYDMDGRESTFSQEVTASI